MFKLIEGYGFNNGVGGTFPINYKLPKEGIKKHSK